MQGKRQSHDTTTAPQYKAQLPFPAYEQPLTAQPEEGKSLFAADDHSQWLGDAAFTNPSCPTHHPKGLLLQAATAQGAQPHSWDTLELCGLCHWGDGLQSSAGCSKLRHITAVPMRWVMTCLQRTNCGGSAYGGGVLPSSLLPSLCSTSRTGGTLHQAVM